jgi:hypothetical protein
MFATIKNLIPEPRQAEHPRHYVGRHRKVDPLPPPSAPVSPAPVGTTTPASPAPVGTDKPAEETAAV